MCTWPAFHRAEIIREGFSVVIVGRPNAGKSSLINALARRDVAIVTDEPGTTRDLVHVALDLGGRQGGRHRHSRNSGRRRAGRGDRYRTCAGKRARRRFGPRAARHGGAGPFRTAAGDGINLDVGTKADLVDTSALAAGDGYDLVVSVKAGTGVDELLAMISRRAAVAAGSDGGGIIPAGARHAALLRGASASLTNAANYNARSLELSAEDLRRAAESFGRIAGTIDVEEVLGAIFSEFCIGK